MIDNPNVKLFARYVVLGYFMYLAWELVQPDYANQIKDIGEIATSAIYGSVFGALTFIIKSHFETKVSDKKSKDEDK